MYDLLIKGGRVIDPAQNIDGVTDVAVSCGNRKGSLKLGMDADISLLEITPGCWPLPATKYFECDEVDTALRNGKSGCPHPAAVHADRDEK